MADHDVHGERLSIAHHYTYYTDALVAAIAGHGILMGWQSHVGDKIAAGQLIRSK
ncbi:MAG: hypothetical protein QHC90_08530 [Shinella sp.]|nr:hypothetical protein [Shinella sp.]